MGTATVPEVYLSGARLYGDDFSLVEIEAWYRDEKEGYAELGARDRKQYRYSYHALNRALGFKFLPEGRFHNVLGIGSAYGDEFAPIAARIDRLTIIDPSDAFEAGQVLGVPCSYVKPRVDGTMPFGAATFDLIVCLGVLHHIPNVSQVMGEIARVLAPGGHALVREPIVSLGDWSKPRRGLTKRERGIPEHILRKCATQAGLQVVRANHCAFPLVTKLAHRLGITAYNSATLTRMDWALSALFRRNVRYHASHWAHKLRPTSLYLVLSKP